MENHFLCEQSSVGTLFGSGYCTSGRPAPWQPGNWRKTSNMWQTLWHCSEPFRVIKDRNMYVVSHSRPFCEIQTVRITFKLRSNYVQITFDYVQVAQKLRKYYVKNRVPKQNFFRTLYFFIFQILPWNFQLLCWWGLGSHLRPVYIKSKLSFLARSGGHDDGVSKRFHSKLSACMPPWFTTHNQRLHEHAFMCIFRE